MTALAPGGRLYVSAPHRNRTFRDGLEPLDHPPHHVSRWSPHEFQQLADRFRLTLSGVAIEPPEDAAGVMLTRFVEGWPGPAARAIRSIVWRSGTARRFSRRLAAEGRAVGPTMLAEFQTPS